MLVLRAPLLSSQAWLGASARARGRLGMLPSPRHLRPPLQGMNPSYDEYADSDEDQHDAYLERMKEEGKIREENANDSSDDSGEETGGPAVLCARPWSWGPGLGVGGIALGWADACSVVFSR